MTAPIDVSRASVRQAADLARLRRRRAGLTAGILRRDYAGDEHGADALMPALLRVERAIYQRLAELDAKAGTA